MNRFMHITKDAINRHGVISTYISVASGTYNIDTGTVVNTETSYSLKIYRQHFKANQYNYPNLVNKDTARFYICADKLAFKPNAQDFIIYDNSKYKIDSFQSHEALGEIVLYRLVGVKQ